VLDKFSNRPLPLHLLDLGAQGVALRFSSPD
jgi:hypothetical protein